MKLKTIQIYSLASTWNIAELNISHFLLFHNSRSPCMTIMPDWSSLKHSLSVSFLHLHLISKERLYLAPFQTNKKENLDWSVVMVILELWHANLKAR